MAEKKFTHTLNHGGNWPPVPPPTDRRPTQALTREIKDVTRTGNLTVVASNHVASWRQSVTVSVIDEHFYHFSSHSPQSSNEDSTVVLLSYLTLARSLDFSRPNWSDGPTAFYCH